MILSPAAFDNITCAHTEREKRDYHMYAQRIYYNARRRRRFSLSLATARQSEVYFSMRDVSIVLLCVCLLTHTLTGCGRREILSQAEAHGAHKLVARLPLTMEQLSPPIHE